MKTAALRALGKAAPTMRCREALPPGERGSRRSTSLRGTTDSLTFPLYQPEWKTASSRQVRQATSMTVDRKTITASVFQGTPTPGTDFSSPVVQGYSTTISGEFCTFNPPRAKAQLGGGWRFMGKVGIASDSDGPHRRGVDATCNSIHKTLGSALKDFLALIFAKGASSKDAHCNNPSFDALLRQGDRAIKPAQAIMSYQGAERPLVTDMPVIP
jgi:oligopeptide transport system substrate-binding protein